MTPHLRKLWPSRLHQQLVLMVSLSLLLALGLLGGYTASELTSEAQRSQEAHAAALARSVAAACIPPSQAGDMGELASVLRRAADFDEVRHITVASPQGQVLVEVRRDDGQPPQAVQEGRATQIKVPSVASPQLRLDASTDLIVAWHPVQTPRLDAWVRLEYDARALLQMRSRIWRNTFVVAMLAISLCATLMAIMLRRPLRALYRAKAFAKELVNAEGRQMQPRPAPLEIMELNAALNEASMLLKQQMIMIEDGLRQHQTHESRLAAQNDQLSAIFAMSHDGLVTFDQTDHVQFANRAFMSLTGLRPAQVIGKTQLELENRLRELAASGSSFTSLDACFNALAQPQDVPEGGYTLVLAGERGAVLTLSGQRSATGAVSRVLYVCDVTKQRALDQMKSDFLSMAAHELRTPMVSIFGFTELMLKRDIPPEQQKDLMARIHRQCQSMIAILNELLDLARIESRRGRDFKLERIDLSTVVHDTLADFKPPPGREPPVMVDTDEELPVEVDVHKMQQAVANLLSNAYKYSPQGGPVVVKLLRGTGADRRPTMGVQVIDEGLGMSPEHVARVGERFFRVDKTGNIPGTGLGLSIVKELLDLMGGAMHVQSELGRGTTITLWMPQLVKAEATAG
jgi:two-component system, OmpR family, sensor histidine kinase VicK